MITFRIMPVRATIFIGSAALHVRQYLPQYLVHPQLIFSAVLKVVVANSAILSKGITFMLVWIRSKTTPCQESVQYF